MEGLFHFGSVSMELTVIVAIVLKRNDKNSVNKRKQMIDNEK